MLIKPGQFLLKYFQGLGKRFYGHLVSMFSKSQTRNGASKGGKTSVRQEPGMGQCIFPGKIVMPLIEEENKTPARQGSSIGNDLSISPMTFCHDHKQGL